MASLNHSLDVLHYHSGTAACTLSWPMLKYRTQWNTVMRAGALPPQIADNQRCNAFFTHEPRDTSLPMILAFIMGLLAMRFDR